MNEELTKVDKLLDDERFCHLDLGDRVPDSTIFSPYLWVGQRIFAHNLWQSSRIG